MLHFLLVMFVSVNIFASQRIVTLSPSINEVVFALGKGNEVVGNTSYCDYPDPAKNITKVGGYFAPSLEKILALNPSIVIMQQNNHALNEKLKKLQIQTKVIQIDTLANIKQSILDIGQIVENESEAVNIVNAIEQKLLELQGIVKDKKILIVFGHNTSLGKSIFVAGQNLYFDEIITMSENQNALISSRRGQPVLNMENIIALNPDIVILLAHSMEQKHLTPQMLIKPWKELPISAAAKNAVYIIDKKYAGIPSDRLIYFLEDFKGVLRDYKKNN